METTVIEKWKLAHILDALNLASRTLNSRSKESAMDRKIIKSIEMIEELIKTK